MLHAGSNDMITGFQQSLQNQIQRKGDIRSEDNAGGVGEVKKLGQHFPRLIDDSCSCDGEAMPGTPRVTACAFQEVRHGAQDFRRLRPRSRGMVKVNHSALGRNGRSTQAAVYERARRFGHHHIRHFGVPRLRNYPQIEPFAGSVAVIHTQRTFGPDDPIRLALHIGRLRHTPAIKAGDRRRRLGAGEIAPFGFGEFLDALGEISPGELDWLTQRLQVVAARNQGKDSVVGKNLAARKNEWRNNRSTTAY